MHDENTVLVPLTQGKFAIIDAEDAEEILKYKWYLRRDGYPARNAPNPSGRRQITVLMHNAIINTPEGMFADHRDRDRCNNRRSNLRVVTRAQNMMNRAKLKNNSSGFKGVSWHAPTRKWRARIHHGKPIYLGYFPDAESAARAYDIAAREYQGDYAVLNFPDHD